MKNKRGWMRILEATIAVLIVSGTLLVVYSKQIDRTVSPASYFEDLQGQILADVVTNRDLRLNVLNADNDSRDNSDGNFSELNDFINDTISDSFGYSIQICNLSSYEDYCKMDYPTFVATLGKNIFTEEVMISAELGDGNNAVYEPKKVKLFVWEGEIESLLCVDDARCHKKGIWYACSDDNGKVIEKTCVVDEYGCLAYTDMIKTDCTITGEVCENEGIAKCVFP